MSKGIPAALVLLLAGCGPGSEPDDLALGRWTGTLQNGEAADHPAIGEAGCPATLIAPQAALTAAHCRCGVQRAASCPEIVPGTKRGMGIMFALDGWETYIYAASIPRDYAERAPTIRSIADRADLVRIPGDLAVLHLAEPIEGIEYPELAEEPPEMGEELALWNGGGFGTASVAPWGFEFDGKKIEGVDDVNIVTLGPNSGHEESKGAAYLERGDSGGPTFATRDGKQVLVGVHSAVPPVEGALNYDIRVDVYRDWILDQIENPPIELLDAGRFVGTRGKADTADSAEPWPTGCAVTPRQGPQGVWPWLALVIVLLVQRRRARRLLAR